MTICVYSFYSVYGMTDLSHIFDTSHYMPTCTKSVYRYFFWGSSKGPLSPTPFSSKVCNDNPMFSVWVHMLDRVSTFSIKIQITLQYVWCILRLYDTVDKKSCVTWILYRCVFDIALIRFNVMIYFRDIAYLLFALMKLTLLHTLVYTF